MVKLRVKRVVFLVLSVLLLSCSEDEGNIVIDSPKEDKVVAEIDFSINKINIRNNIQVGDKISLVIENITDSNPTENVIYKLIPTGRDKTRHQVLNESYTLQVKTKKGMEDSSYEDISQLDIKPTESVKVFYVAPKEAGTYQIDFSLQKYNTQTKKFVGKPVVKRVVFNAVKINFLFPARQVRKSNFWRRSKHERRWKFSIDDGNRKYDNYLSNKNTTKRYTYKTYYDKQTKMGNFVPSSQYYEFRNPYVQKRSTPDLKDFPQTMDITIIQYLKDGTKNIIEYKKVKLIY